jgi:hypothetical protein
MTQDNSITTGMGTTVMRNDGHCHSKDTTSGIVVVAAATSTGAFDVRSAASEASLLLDDCECHQAGDDATSASIRSSQPPSSIITLQELRTSGLRLQSTNCIHHIHYNNSNSRRQDETVVDAVTPTMTRTTDDHHAPPPPESTHQLRKRDSSHTFQLRQESTAPPESSVQFKNHQHDATKGTCTSQMLNDNTTTTTTTDQTTMEATNGKKSRPNVDAATATASTDDTSTVSQAALLPHVFLLPSPSSSSNHMDPDEFLLELVSALYPQVQLQVQRALDLSSSPTVAPSSPPVPAYFPIVTEEQMARYHVQVVEMTRTNDVTALRQYCAQHGPTALNCYNRFGEGLLNTACRRGYTEMVEFLLSPPVQLPVRVRDDYGRTPLHDACWNPTPQLEICTWILQRDPS